MDFTHVCILSAIFTLVVGAFKTPKGLNVTVMSPTTLHMSWDKVIEKSRESTSIYIVRYRATGEPYNFTETADTKIKSVQVRANVTYEISVRLAQGQRVSPWSRAVYVNTLQAVNISTVHRPRSVRVKGLSPTTIKIKWRRPKMRKSQISGYRLVWKRKRASKRHTVNVTRRSHIVSGLKPNTVYTIRIQTISNDDRLSLSTGTTYRTQMRLVGSPPENITVVALGSTKVKVSWQPPKYEKEKVSEYKIQYKRKGVKRGDMCTLTTNPWKREYTITDLFKGETYKIRMAAKTGHNTGPTSSWSTVKLPVGAKDGRSNFSSTQHSTEQHPSQQEKMDKLFDLDVAMINGGVNVTWKNVGMDVISYSLSVTKDGKIVYIDEVPFDQPLYAVILSLHARDMYNVTVRATGPTGNEVGISTMPLNTPEPISVAVTANPFPFIGGNLTLSCKVSGFPKPEILWMRGDNYERMNDGAWFDRITEETFSDPLSQAYVSTLVIENLTMVDQTKYACSAANDLEVVMKEINITVRDPVPSPIRSVVVVPLSPYQVDINWEPPEEENFSKISYRILLAKGGSNVTQIFVSDEPQYTVGGLSPDTLYYLTVISYSKYGETDGDRTTVFVFRTNKVLPKPLLNMMTLNETTFLVRWTIVSELHANLYKITYGIQGGNETIARKVLPPENEILLYDIIENSDYKVKVDAIYDDGVSTSGWVNASSKRTSFLSEARPPTPPADVFLNVNNSTLFIRWLPPYVEYRTLVRWYQLDMYKGQNNLYRKRISADITNYTVYPFDDKQQHTVYISAVNLKGASDAIYRVYQPSNEDEISVYTVGNLRGRPVNSTAVRLEWSRSESIFLTRYLVRYRTMDYNKSDIVDTWLDPSHNIYIVTGLQEYQRYIISVIPYINDKNGNESSVIVQTFSAVPSSPPLNVTLVNVSSTTVSLRWEPPSVPDRNGEIIKYRVAYQNGNDYDIDIQDVNVTEARLTDLHPNSYYLIRVAAVTVNGTGPYSNGTTLNTPVIPANLEPPGLPLNFSTSPIPYGLHLKWFPPENPDVPVEGYIVGYGRFIPEVYREILGPDTFQYTIHKLRQNNKYIVSLRTFNDNGESPAGFIVAKAGDGKMSTSDGDDDEDDIFVFNGNLTDDGFDDAPFDVRVEVNHDDVPSALVRWQSPINQRAKKIKGYIVYYKTKEEKGWHAVYERLLSSTIKNLAFSTSYSFRVQVQYKDGSQGKLSKTVKAKTKSLDDIVRVLPKPTITSVFSGSDYLQVNWKPPLSDYLHVIVGFTLGYGIHEANENQEFISVSQRSFKIERLKADQEYIISLRMFNEHGQSDKVIVKAKTLASAADGNGTE